MQTLATYDGLKVPTWALPYLVNADDSGLTTEEHKQIDIWFSDFERIALKTDKSIAQFCAGDGDEYFTWRPAFGLACTVMDCTVLILVPETPINLATLAG